MQIGEMKNPVQIYKMIKSQSATGQVINTPELYLNIKVKVSFEKTVESGSKFDASWSNRLILETRYSHNFMEVINDRSSYKFKYQGSFYSVKNYEQYNMQQRFIKFYIEKDV